MTHDDEEYEALRERMKDIFWNGSGIGNEKADAAIAIVWAAAMERAEKRIRAVVRMRGTMGVEELTNELRALATAPPKGDAT